MLRRPKLRRRARVAHDVERIGECDEAMTNVAFQVVRDDVLASTRDEDARRGFTLRRSVEAQGRGMERAKRRIGKFLARLDGTKLDGANIKEQLERAKARTSAVLKDIKVPKVEDLKNLIDDIREEQTLAQYHPDRKRLSSVADFFIYTEEEGTLNNDDVDSTTCASGLNHLGVYANRRLSWLVQVVNFLKKSIVRGRIRSLLMI